MIINQITSKGQLLAITIAAYIFTISTIVMVYLGEFPFFTPIIIVAGIIRIYVKQLNKYDIDRKEKTKWKILLIFFNLLVIPFFWRKFL